MKMSEKKYLLLFVGTFLISVILAFLSSSLINNYLYGSPYGFVFFTIKEANMLSICLLITTILAAIINIFITAKFINTNFSDNLEGKNVNKVVIIKSLIILIIFMIFIIFAIINQKNILKIASFLQRLPGSLFYFSETATPFDFYFNKFYQYLIFIILPIIYLVNVKFIKESIIDKKTLIISLITNTTWFLLFFGLLIVWQHLSSDFLADFNYFTPIIKGLIISYFVLLPLIIASYVEINRNINQPIQSSTKISIKKIFGNKNTTFSKKNDSSNMKKKDNKISKLLFAILLIPVFFICYIVVNTFVSLFFITISGTLCGTVIIVCFFGLYLLTAINIFNKLKKYLIIRIVIIVFIIVTIATYYAISTINMKKSALLFLHEKYGYDYNDMKVIKINNNTSEFLCIDACYPDEGSAIILYKNKEIEMTYYGRQGRWVSELEYEEDYLY